MKFILEETNKRLIDNINEDIKSGEMPPLFVSEFDRKYCLEFKIIDIAKANSFIMDMMTHNPDIRKEIEDKLGIEVTAVKYDNGNAQVDNLKSLLREVLERLENM